MNQLVYPTASERLTTDKYLSQWQVRFAHRIAQLERGKVYTLVLYVPDGTGGEPVWSVQHEAKAENTR